MVSSLCVPPPLPRPVKNHLGFKLGTLASFLLYFILSSLFGSFVGLAYQGKDLVFRFIIEYIVAWWILAPTQYVYFYVRIFERWYFGLCWNLRLFIEL
jgi:hypothetical protein